jgi:hypothetical protein
MPSSPLPQLGKYLIFSGLALIAVGVAFVLGGRLGLGRLPGDIELRGKETSFYFPIITCLLVSLLLTIVLNLFWGRR